VNRRWLSAVTLPVAIALLLVSGSTASGAPATTNFRAAGKIYCLLSKQGGPQARCDIKKHSYRVPPKPSTCIDHSYGIGAFILGNAKADYVCTGQPLWLNPEPGDVLAAGKSVSLGPVSCSILTSGVRCTNESSGHGFKISAKKLKLF
jgi:hypothetical protein